MVKKNDVMPEYFKSEEFYVTGRHKDYVDRLWTQNKIKESYFKRLVDIYCIAPVIGLMAGRTAEADGEGSDKRTVQLMQITDCYLTLIQIMRLVLILDKTRGLDAEERVNSAFRPPETKEEYEANMELFNSYARGGIEVLYEQLVLRVDNEEYDEYDDSRVNNILNMIKNPHVEGVI